MSNQQITTSSYPGFPLKSANVWDRNSYPDFFCRIYRQEKQSSKANSGGRRNLCTGDRTTKWRARWWIFSIHFIISACVIYSCFRKFYFQNEQAECHWYMTKASKEEWIGEEWCRGAMEKGRFTNFIQLKKSTGSGQSLGMSSKKISELVLKICILAFRLYVPSISIFSFFSFISRWIS